MLSHRTESSEVANIFRCIRMDERERVFTLTTLSQPDDTMTGLETLGLKRTHETLETRELRPLERSRTRTTRSDHPP